MTHPLRLRQPLLCLCLAAALGATASGTLAQSAPPYMNGGIGAGEQASIKATAADYNLQLLFSQGGSGEYISDVKLDITDSAGKTVFSLPAAGPMTNVKLPPGKYQLNAVYNGQAQTRQLTLGAQPSKLSLRWNDGPK
ncbi:hypothetical protein [Herbaspirillum sp. YR522]|uniref:hypothetical protein n=1 Tax=Herbaspirillum sp. YR522 TaxID=1144342 RepID=UPI00026F7F1A|nr:hypothetical protein [Herbaspirillum sp. YR522]EJN10059.1 hypothetical protein PMI40_00322 [Herbaspirillum sp. YR522]